MLCKCLIADRHVQRLLKLSLSKEKSNPETTTSTGAALHPLTARRGGEERGGVHHLHRSEKEIERCET